MYIYPCRLLRSEFFTSHVFPLLDNLILFHIDTGCPLVMGDQDSVSGIGYIGIGIDIFQPIPIPNQFKEIKG